MSQSGGVVERASKELSRRFTSFAARTRRGTKHEKLEDITEQKHKEDNVEQSAEKSSDVLNGNAGPAPGWQPHPLQPEEKGHSKSGMGITRGTVMDKVTNIFSSHSEPSIMGNQANKEKEKEKPDINGINIPKGAVANGRAKFESQKISPEKPLRFFGSRSRPATPLLPVKAPKVPAPADPSGGTPGPVKKKANSAGVSPDKDDSPTLEIVPFGSQDGGRGEGRGEKREVVIGRRGKPWVPWEQLWQDYKFLAKFFKYFSVAERVTLAQVCRQWREVLYQPPYWRQVRPVLHCRDLRLWNSSEEWRENKRSFYLSIKLRGYDNICLLNANDADVFDFIQNYPHGAQHIHILSLRCCNLTDRGLEALMEFLQSLYSLEINGCNEVTEQGLWSSLHPRLISLTVTDCINVADECICAITQLLPALYEFNLQAYHVTDSALSYFSPKQTGTMSVLRLQSCWEVTNHGLVNIVHSLPNLTILSLSGCSKITDDGIELIAENLRKLVSLDVSWCPRITDAALEYIACDLTHLEELTLDRCVHISDIGVGYISTMLALSSLFLRWCTQIRDFGLQHICGMRNLHILSVAGCSQLTSSGLSNLIQLRQLEELELTNCPGSSKELVIYLRENLGKCLVVE